MRTRRPRSPRGSGEQLRDEIVAAAKELMAGAPTAESVAMRAVAQAVGVTAPTIYRHFADKDDLITAVCIDVFADLDQEMVRVAEGLTDPLERLWAYGQAYVRFAVDHPEHYRLALMDRRVPRPDLDLVLSQGAWQHMLEVVEECVAADLFTTRDPLAITLDLWAAVHGLAALLIAKPFLPWGDHDAVVDRVLRAAALGHMVTPEQAGLPALPDLRSRPDS